MSTLQAGSTIDVGRALDQGSWGRYSKVVLLLSSLAICVDGLANQVLALAIPALIKAWGLARSDFAPVTALGLVGISVGTAIAGVLGDRFGRRLGLIGSVLLFGLMTTAMGMVDNLFSLAILRVLAGLGLGGAIPNAASLIAEFTPLPRRSRAITLGMIFIPIGGTLSGFIAAAVMDTHGWRALFFISGLLCVALAVVFMLVLPESPRFLLRRPAKRDKLVKVLTKMGYQYDASATLIDGAEARPKSSAVALFGPDVRRDTLVLWAAFFFALLGLYSIFNWAPAMLAGQGFDFQVVGKAMGAFGLGGIAGGLIGTWMIERLGSRFSMLLICAGGFIGAMILVYFPVSLERGMWYAVFALAIEGAFLSGAQTTLIALAAFVYPASVRGTGVGSGLAVGRIGAVLSAFSGTIALSAGGASGYFLSIGLAMALTFVALLFVRRHIPRVSPQG